MKPHVNIFVHPYYIVFPTNLAYCRHPDESCFNFMKHISTHSLVIPEDASAYMPSYRLNEHHLRCDHYWNNIIPKVFDFVGISYDLSIFDLIPYSSEDGLINLSYHAPKPAKRCTYQYYDRALKSICGDDSILRLTNSASGMTNYHRLFRGAHDVGVIVNKTIDSDEHILLHCDSMFIQIVPIMARFVKSITFIDNRSATWFMRLPKYQPYTKCIIARISANMNPYQITRRFR